MEPYASDKPKRKKRKIFRFPNDGSFQEDVEDIRIAAMITPFLSISERVLEELNAGDLKHICIEGSDGFIMLSKNGENLIFQTLPKEESD